MDGKAIVSAIIALILYIVFAIIYFIILAFIINFGAGLVGVGDVGAPSLAVAAAILAGATIIAGGGLMDAFKNP
jgi:hypothetical protein